MNGFAYGLLVHGFSTVYVYGMVWELKETDQSMSGCNDKKIKSKHKRKTAVNERNSLTVLLWRRCQCVCVYVYANVNEDRLPCSYSVL